MKYKLIVTIVNSGYSTTVMDAIANTPVLSYPLKLWASTTDGCKDKKVVVLSYPLKLWASTTRCQQIPQGN